jgi:sensor histidine kinase YesM
MKAQQELDAAKYNSLVARLKTHDISNKILSMRHLAKDKEGVAYVENLAARARKSLSAAHHNYWSLTNELECIEQDLLLYNANVRQKVEFLLRTDDSIDKDELLLPPLSLQPFVENALKHGLHHLEDRPPLLTLDIAEIVVHNTECLQVTIADNGIGRERSQQIQQRNKMSNSMSGNWGSYSTPIIIEAWDKFNEGIVPKDESVSIENLRDDDLNPIGTKVVVKFRKKMEKELNLTVTEAMGN